MTADEKRSLIVRSALTREKKNRYSQAENKRLLIESGYGDCSGTILYWYLHKLGMDIGINTEAQINSKLGKRVKLTITDGVPDESKMKPADCLYFRGSDNSRTEGVGHVEMYIGNGQCFGHGSGTGGTVKNLATYCKYRQKLTSTSKIKNKGLICVIRFIPDDAIKEEDLPMTAEEKREFNDLKNSVQNLNDAVTNLIKAIENSKERVYHTIDELPASWAQPVIKKLIGMGVSIGTGEDLNLSETMLRTIILADRIAGAYQEKVYHFTSDVPAWYRPTIQKLLDRKIFNGRAADDLGLPETMARIFTVLDNAKMFDEKVNK